MEDAKLGPAAERGKIGRPVREGGSESSAQWYEEQLHQQHRDEQQQLRREQLCELRAFKTQLLQEVMVQLTPPSSPRENWNERPTEGRCHGSMETPFLPQTQPCRLSVSSDTGEALGNPPAHGSPLHTSIVHHTINTPTNSPFIPPLSISAMQTQCLGPHGQPLSAPQAPRMLHTPEHLWHLSTNSLPPPLDSQQQPAPNHSTCVSSSLPPPPPPPQMRGVPVFTTTPPSQPCLPQRPAADCSVRQSLEAAFPPQFFTQNTTSVRYNLSSGHNTESGPSSPRTVCSTSPAPSGMATPISLSASQTGPRAKYLAVKAALIKKHTKHINDLKRYYELQLARLRASLQHELETRSTQTLLASPAEIPKHGSTDSVIDILQNKSSLQEEGAKSQKSNLAPGRPAVELHNSGSPQDEDSGPEFQNKSTQTFVASPPGSPPQHSPRAYQSEPSLAAYSSTTGSITRQMEEMLRTENTALRNKCTQLESQMEKCAV